MATTAGTETEVRTGHPRLPPSPQGSRVQRRQWRDPRLVVGVLLVTGSVLGVAWVVNATDDTVGVWVVSRDVPAGNPIGAQAVEEARVRLPDVAPYLPAAEALPPQLTATRDFAAGELLTRAGTAVDGEPQDIRLVTLPVLRNQLPADLAEGDRVDVYVVERGASGEPDSAPRLVIGDVLVSAVDGETGAFGGSSLEVGVALAVPSDRVAEVVDAQARGTVTLVDVPVGSS